MKLLRLRNFVKKLRKPAIVIAATGLILLIYHYAALELVKRAEAETARDPESGFLVGGAPETLGPAHAPAAALLVHGFVGGPNNFNELPRRLAEAGIHTHVMHLPGHGTTPRDLRDVRGSQLLQSVIDRTRQLKDRHEQVFLVGHSLGSALCALTASFVEVDGLVLGAPYFGITYQWYYVLPPEFWGIVTSPFIRWTYKGDAFVRINRKEVSDEILSYRWIPASATLTLIDIGKKARDPLVLSEIACPTLMFHSPTDHAASPAKAKKAFTQVGADDKELIWLDNSDHHIYWDHDREQVYETIIEFVQEHSAKN